MHLSDTLLTESDIEVILSVIKSFPIMIQNSYLGRSIPSKTLEILYINPETNSVIPVENNSNKCAIEF